MDLALRFIFALLFLLSLAGGLRGLIGGARHWQRPGLAVSVGVDNVFRFMSGVYLGVSGICLWMTITMDEQGVLIYLVAFTVFLGGVGRAVSLTVTKVPDKSYFFYMMAELSLPVLIVVLSGLRGG